MRGRKPKPTQLKIIEGNPGKRPLNQSEPKPQPIAPACPSWLTKIAQAEWHRVAGELERLGLLTTIDQAALAGYCQSYARWRETQEIIDKGGSDIKLAKLGQAYLAQVRQFCVEFGLTPSSRGRMTVPGEKDGAECPRCSMPLEFCGCG